METLPLFGQDLSYVECDFFPLQEAHALLLVVNIYRGTCVSSAFPSGTERCLDWRGNDKKTRSLGSSGRSQVGVDKRHTAVLLWLVPNQ